MRQFLLIACLLLYMLPISAQNSSEFELQFDRSEFEITRSANDSVSIVPKSTEYSYDNTSALSGFPRRLVNVWLPKNSINVECNLLSKNRVLLYSGVSIAAAPADIPTSGMTQSEQSQVPSDKDRSNNSKSTETLQTISYTTVNSLSNGSVAHLSICPFEYEKATGSLYMITDLYFSVSYYENIRVASQQNIWNPEMTEAIRNTATLSITLTADDFSIYQDQTSVELDFEGLDYAIITTSALSDSFKDIANWKNMKGVRTEIIKIEDIQNSWTGSSLQEKIKREIQYLFKYRGLKYVLLGGDDTVVPVRLCRAVCSGLTKDIPSDLYYVCFNGDFGWDGNNNGIYGEKDDSVDFAASLFISRLPVRTASDISAYSEKLLKYERFPLDANLNNKMLIGGTALFSTPAPGSQSDAAQKGDKLYSDYIEPYWNGQRIRFYDTVTDFPGDASYDFNAINLQNELSNGYSFVDIMTHGGTDVWKMETGSYYSSTHGAAVDNSGYTHMATMACSTNEFDAVKDPCLSESFIRNGNSGVLSYLGSSREGWGTYSSSALGSSLLYEAEYYKELFNPNVKYKNFAKLVFAAKSARISASEWNSSQRWLQFSLNAIGDPEMYVYTDTPKRFGKINISYEQDDELLLVESQDYCDITITSTNENGERYYSTIKNTNSAGFKNINSATTICVTYPGYAPAYSSLAFYKGMYTISPVVSSMLSSHDEELPISESFFAKSQNINMQALPGNQFVDIVIDADNINDNIPYIIQVQDVIGNIIHAESLRLFDGSTTRIAGLARGFYVVSLLSENSIICSKRVCIK